MRRMRLAAVAVAVAGLGCQDEGDEGGADEAEQGAGSEADCQPGSLGCECVEDSCLGSLECVEGVCAEAECTPGSAGCPCVEGECLGDLVCEDELCTDPGGTTTEGETGTTTESGSGEDSSSEEDSSEDSGSTTGEPESTCDNPDGAFGCVFYGAKLPAREPFFDDYAMQFTIGNPGPGVANVVVELNVDGQWDNVAGPLPVAASDTHSFYFFGGGDIVPQGLAEGYGYRISSDAPIVAHQYSPHDEIGRGGGSLLLPAPVLGHEYQVFHVGGSGLNPYFVVVASVDDTTVFIDPSQPLEEAPGVPPTSSPFQVLMHAGETLRVEADDFYAGVLNGTEISTDAAHPIAVFVGGYGSSQTYHYEEQLLPLSLLGTLHPSIAAGATREGDNDDGEYFVVGVEATDYTITSAPGFYVQPDWTEASIDPKEIRSFDVWKFGSAPEFGELLFESVDPIMVFGNVEFQYPAMAQLIPYEHAATRYGLPVVDFLLSTTQVAVAYPANTELTIDGGTPPGLLYPPYEFAPGWWVARFVLDEGMHVLEADQPVIVTMGDKYLGLPAGLVP